MLSIREREIILQKIWDTQKYDSRSLFTRSGKKLEVLFRGTENLDGGPDFKDAIIKISGILLKGDIELHLEDSGWYAHKHHQDPKYNRVVLHVISEPAASNSFVEREDGVKVEQLYLPIPEDEIFLWKQNKEENSAQPQRPQIIEDCPLSKCSQEQIWATVEAAARERFFDKVEQVSEARFNHSWDQIIYEKILEALGYSKNQKPFRTLAKLIPFETLRAEMQWVSEETSNQRCAALLFGAAGLLPARDATLNSEALAYTDKLKSLWEEISRRLSLKPIRQEDWQFFRLRPQNFPTRRIAGAVMLLSRFSKEGILGRLIKIVRVNSKDSRKIQAELEKLFCQKSYGIWKSHYVFTGSSPNMSIGKDLLIGKDRARDVVINIVLPVLYSYALEAEDIKLKTVIFELLKRYPSAQTNTIIRNMGIQLFQTNNNRGRINSAHRQQGLIQLNKLYCANLDCEKCLNLHKVVL